MAGLSFSLQAQAKAVRLADEFQDVSAMSEPIEKGGGSAFVTKDLRPVGEVPVGGDEQGAPLVSGAAELEQ